MTNKLKELCSRASEITTGHEAMELSLSVGELAKGDPVVFLLKELAGEYNEAATYKDLWEQWHPIAQLVNDDSVVAYMIACHSGLIAPKVLEFVLACRNEWEGELKSGMEKHGAEIDVISQQCRAALV